MGVGRCWDCGHRVRGRHPEQSSDALGAVPSQVGPLSKGWAANPSSSWVLLAVSWVSWRRLVVCSAQLLWVLDDLDADEPVAPLTAPVKPQDAG